MKRCLELLVTKEMQIKVMQNPTRNSELDKVEKTGRNTELEKASFPLPCKSVRQYLKGETHSHSLTQQLHFELTKATWKWIFINNKIHRLFTAILPVIAKTEYNPNVYQEHYE